MASAEPYASLHLAPRVNHASTPPLSFYRPDALPAVQPTATKLWRHSTEGTKAQCIYNKTQIVKTQISTLSYDYNACMKRWLQYRILSNARRVYPSRLRSAGSILTMIRKDVNEVYPEKMITACGNTCNWSSVKTGLESVAFRLIRRSLADNWFLRAHRPISPTTNYFGD